MAWIAFLALGGTALGLLVPIAACSGVYPTILLVFGGLSWCLGGLRAIWLLLVFAWVALHIIWTLDDRLPRGMSGQDSLIEGVISDFPRASHGVVRFRFSVAPDALQPGVPASIYLSWYDIDELPKAGQRWQLLVRLRSPRGMQNPGGFDFERWLFRQRIGATGYVRRSSMNARLLAWDRNWPLLAIRTAVVHRVEQALSGEPGLRFVLGLAVGARHLLTNDDWELLRRTGTSHLMAISGLHVGLAAALFLWLGRSMGRLLLRLAVPVSPHRWGLGMALAGALGYGAMAGFGVPTLRACCMLAVLTLLNTNYRHGTVYDSLSVAVLVVIGVDPFAVLSAGFWLSFSAVVLLCLCISHHRSATVRDAGGAGSYQIALGIRPLQIFHTALRTQVLIVAGLAPILLTVFGELSLIAPFVNLLAIPLFATIVIPAVLVGSALLLLIPSAGIPLLQFLARLLEQTQQLLGVVAAPDFAIWVAPPLDAAVALLGVAATAILIAPRPVPGRWLAPLLLVPVLSGQRPDAFPEWRMTVFDVGHGLSVLVETADHALLYDTGPAYRSGDAAKSAILPSLRALGIRRLDVVIVSHGDSDHSGGVRSILSVYTMARLLAPLQFEGLTDRYAECHSGLRWNWDGVQFAVLHPEAAIDWSDNNASCVLLVQGTSGKLLLPGDIERRVEKALLEQAVLTEVDVVVAPHHGSRTSSSAAFVQALRPAVAVFSAGHENRWGFPDETVLNRWRNSGACSLTTAENGAIIVESRPDASVVLVRRERYDARQPWLEAQLRVPECEPLLPNR